MELEKLKHPTYVEKENLWYKWRLTYDAGDDFILQYLKKFSSRESDPEFQDRQNISYVPAFAAAAIDEIKDAIFQRISDVTRSGGSQSYNDAVKGLNGGVDASGTSMNSLIGRVILPDLLTMKKIGVFIDMPKLNSATLADQLLFQPYLYCYKIENIWNWTKKNKKDTFNTLLLRDWVEVKDETTGLLIGYEEQFRLLNLINGVVAVTFLDKNGNILNEDIIDLPEIPFVIFELPHSLLENIANYQIALLNLASSDIAYVLKSNFPFYVEQYDPRVDNLYARPAQLEGSVTVVQAGEQKDTVTAKPYEIAIGTSTGRRVPKGLEMPDYIAPPTEPLLASMQKQEELKRDIRMLVKLNVANLTPKMASGESKAFDERSLEAGLSAIGLELEHGERSIARYWQMYENKTSKEFPTIKYPEKYSLQSDKDKRAAAKDLRESTKGHPSITYKKEVYKITSSSLIGASISKQTLDKINTEIDAAEVIVTDPEELIRDIELTLIDPETASKAKGYPEGVIEKANKAHAERVSRIAESQMKARGALDLGGLGNASRDEKMNTDDQESGQRGTK